MDQCLGDCTTANNALIISPKNQPGHCISSMQPTHWFVKELQILLTRFSAQSTSSEHVTHWFNSALCRIFHMPSAQSLSTSMERMCQCLYCTPHHHSCHPETLNTCIHRSCCVAKGFTFGAIRIFCTLYTRQYVYRMQ